MANAYQRNKDAAVVVGASVFNPQTANPISTGDVGLYATSAGLMSVDAAGAETNLTAGLKQATVTLTNAQVKLLRGTPITLVAAPGAGYFLEFVSAELFFDRTAVYTESADNLAIKYTDGSGQAASEDIEATGFLDAATDAIMPVKPVTSAVILKAAGENKALVLHNTGDGEYGGGNAANTLKCIVNYRTHATGF